MEIPHRKETRNSPGWQKSKPTSGAQGPSSKQSSGHRDSLSLSHPQCWSHKSSKVSLSPVRREAPDDAEQHPGEKQLLYLKAFVLRILTEKRENKPLEGRKAEC